MTAGERRGERLFVILAALTVLVKPGGVFLGLAERGTGVGGFLTLVLVPSVPFLWRGTAWLRRLVSLTCVLSGALSLLHCARSLVDFDVLGSSLVFDGILGVVDVLAGLAFLFLPDLNAFFRHQREGKPRGASRQDGTSPTPWGRRRVKAACGWGLLLGCGSGLLLAAEWVRSMGFGLGWDEVVVGLLVGAGAGGLLGLVAGLAAGAAGPGEGLTIGRLAVTRGLIAAGVCVTTAVVGAAIYGGLFGLRSAFYGNNPGWGTAALAALIWAVYAGPILAAAGLVHGAAIALLVRDNSPG
jgi:hypothetical protein